MTTIQVINRQTDEVIDEIFDVDERSWDIYWRMQGDNTSYTWRSVED